MITPKLVNMRFFKPIGVKDFECVSLCDTKQYEILSSLDGTPCLSVWRPLKAERVKDDETQEGRASDFPWMACNLVMRQKAVDALRDILKKSGEILPLATDDGVELYLLNVHGVDALDEEKSSIVRYEKSGKIMLITKAVFFDNALEGVDIFRLPHKGGQIYVSEVFVERVRTAGLVGIDFIDM